MNQTDTPCGTMQLTTTENITSPSVVEVEGGNLELSAQSPEEIVQCHGAMIQWCQRKVAVMQGEAKELRDSAIHAKAHKWNSKTLEKHATIAEKRVIFYQKMLGALEAGYHIIPPMRLELFAIRTNKDKPKPDWTLCKWSGQHNFQQSAQVLPQGEGDYQNPQPVVLQDYQVHKVQEYNQTVEKRGYWADSWDEMEFPANMARLHVMRATDRAMALKVFDDLGMLPADRKRNPDPMIVGRIHDPRMIYGQPKMTVHFLIAWHIDTRTL